MEELLQKNIFNDKDLAKLSPDFSSSNVLLRMQLRDTMVKDTHSHSKLKSDGLQRKIIKHPKDCSKIGKEIANIRNSFQSINLKNQIMLKNAVKCVDILKSEHFINGFNNEFNTLGHAEETYLKSIAEMNLVLKNDTDFKINEKPNSKPIKLSRQPNDYKIQSPLIENDNDAGKTDDAIAHNKILRIECTLLKPSSPLLDIAKPEITSHKNVDVHDNNQCQVSLHETAKRNKIDKDGNDLQSLLIMLPISPSTNRNEIEASDNFGLSKFGDEKDDESKLHPINFNSTQCKNDEVHGHEVDDLLNVIPMRIEIDDRYKVLMKKYVEKWKCFVSNKKQLLAQQREETLNIFFDKLSKRKTKATESPESPINKVKHLARDYNRYRHRYQVQKHIIALQKAKLEEQTRIIEELKYNRIIEASKMSVDAMREEVRKTYYEMDKQLKPKLKCLTSELKVEIEEPALVLHCLKVPQFLQRMEKRAREREEKHAMIRERRQQMEEERIRLKQQEELARAQMDKDEKVKRMNELKDKRKREKIENIRKKQHTERMRALHVMAELHYEKSLKAKYGIRPFKILMEIKKDNTEKSKAHYKFQLKKNIFFKWMWYTEDMWYERNFKAEDFHRKKILRKYFNGFRLNHRNFVLKRQVAEDYYDLYVTNLVFRKLQAAVEVVKKENEHKFQIATIYHNSNLLFRAFCSWRSLPALNALKREQEARKARWREKVLQVVPDYTPPDD